MIFYIYCPHCGAQMEREEYNNPRVNMCLACKTIFEFLERPKVYIREKEENES